MQLKTNIKKSVAVTNVLVSLLMNKTYVAVSEIAIFLNIFLGTHTITGQKINKMLEITGYQRQKTEEELQRDDLIDIKYMSLHCIDDLAKIDSIIVDNKKISRLVWKAKILLDIFEINFEKGEMEIMDSIYKNAYKYNLINKENDWIQDDILEENIEYLIEKVKERNCQNED